MACAHTRSPTMRWLLRRCVVPYLNQPSARNSSGVTALDTRWMKPWVRRGIKLARIRGLLTTAVLGPTRIHLAQDPGFEREAWRSRRSSHASGPDVLMPFPVTFREVGFGFFFGKDSPYSSAPTHAVERLRSSGSTEPQGSVCQVVASSPLLVQMPPPRPQTLGLVPCDTFPPVALAHRGQSLGGRSVLRKTDAFSRAGRVFPLVRGLQPCVLLCPIWVS